MTGGGPYCAGGAGAVVGLSGSQSGVNYQLLRGRAVSGNAVMGTGNSISFDPQSTTGTYTVRATNATTNCTQAMSGAVVVSVTPLPMVSISPPSATICAGQRTNLTASGADTYQWNTGAITATISVSAMGPYSVTGTTPINYSTITLRYWLTTENNIPLLFQKNYVAIGQGNLNLQYVALDQPRQGATGYIEYSFQPGAGSLAPMGDSGPLEIQANKQNYSVFDQRDDYSYVNNNSAYLLNSRITAYQNGVIFYGQEPTSVGSARQGAAEAGLVLAVRVLGNPVPGSSVSVEVSGAEGQLLRYELTDVRGQVVGLRQVAQAGTTDQQTFNVSQQPAGLLLLRVSTPTQSQTVKVLRQ